jgi:hypothetical protein
MQRWIVMLGVSSVLWRSLLRIRFARVESTSLFVAVALWAGMNMHAQDPGGQVVSLSVSGGRVRLQFESLNGCSYQVQSSPVVQSRFWNDALTDVSPSGAQTSVSLPAPGENGFFRVLECTNRTFWYDWRYYYQEPVLTEWALGAHQDSYVRADRPYDWYIDQADTGACSENNCGPSSATMAIKWYDSNFAGTAADARRTYPAGGGWWYTSDIINYLNLWSVPCTVSSFTGTQQLMQILSDGQLVILCINAAYLNRDDISEHRVGRFYSYASGHLLVVKGWRMVDTKVFFEVYDPNNWHATYPDQTPKGRNRHLPAAELAEAIAKWWNYLIVVQPTAGGKSAAEKASRGLLPVDPRQIVHQGGM